MTLRHLSCFALAPLCALVAHAAAPAPVVVGVPPSDAGRGLVRVSPTEIRHYSGDKKPLHYLVSQDNGLTWKDVPAPESYPPNFGGVPKEAPAIIQNPRTKEFIRIQPVGDHVFVTKGGLDGEWLAVTKDGKLTADWKTGDRKNLLSLGGIMRNPLFIDKGRRILLPTHSMRRGTEIYISDDDGLTWKKSKSVVSAPPHKPENEHKGPRWYNAALEASIVELANGKLWMFTRTSQDQYYESFSSDRGETWSPAKPSRFFGTLTMPTVGKLKDGRLLMLWTNTHALPELSSAKNDTWEDVFTNRDSHHAAISSDNGKTWRGFRELIIDEHRNRDDYANFGGKEDRGKHQSEFVQLDDNRVLVALGQHKNHRRLMIVDTRWLLEKNREDDFSQGLEHWTYHTYIPKITGHASYNRKPAASLVTNPDKAGAQALFIGYNDDATLVNEAVGADYRAGGATWNFPNGERGRVDFGFRLNAGTAGIRVSLNDRLFNACDTAVAPYALYTLTLVPGEKLGSETLRADTPYRLGIRWNGVVAKSVADLYLNNRKVGTLPLNTTSPNGASYLHFVSLAKKPDPGVLITDVAAKVD